MDSEFIIHVDESDFEYEVLQYSFNAPVLAYFWAPWCVPCRVLGPRLEKQASEGEGLFRLAKINVDENMRLAKQYKVRNVPVVKAFVNGHIVTEFAGMLDNDNLRDFIHRLAPTPDDLLFVKGKNLIELGDYEGAEDAFRAVLSSQPHQAEAVLGLVRALLLQGSGDEPRILLRNFPASSAYNKAQLLKPVAEAFSDTSPIDLSLDDPLEAAFKNSIRLAKRGNILAALDGFLVILGHDRNYRGGQVKDIYVGLLTLLGDSHPDVRQYRQDLSSMLF
jgi:putative thioredoxin